MIKVNIKTKEATREALPKFLKGLKQESLQDLSWTDSALGVQDFGWFNETDVTVYGDTKVLDGTETLTFNTNTKIVEVVKGQRVKTVDELALEQEKLVEEIENGIQGYINEQVKAKGYDNENSIAKYLVQGNPFYDECVTISLWIGSVWNYLIQVQSEVEAGTRTMPTLDELKLELPKLGE